MKKMIFKILSTAILLTCFTTTFANVWVSSYTMKNTTNSLFVGTIKSVDYMNVNEPSDITVALFDQYGDSLHLSFNGVDLPIGAAFLSMAGKNLEVHFLDSNTHTIEFLTVV